MRKGFVLVKSSLQFLLSRKETRANYQKNGRKNKKGKQKERNQAARRSRLTFENQLRLILKAFNIKTDLFEDNS